MELEMMIGRDASGLISARLSLLPPYAKRRVSHGRRGYLEPINLFHVGNSDRQSPVCDVVGKTVECILKFCHS